VTKTGAQLKSTGVAETGHKVENSEGGSAVDTRRVDDGSLHSGGSGTKVGSQLKSTGVAKTVHKDETRVKTPGEGSLSNEGGSAIDARRVVDGSLHSGGSGTKTGAQLKSTGVAKTVHKDETRVKTPGEGSLSSEGGSTVDARRVDVGAIHSDGFVTKTGAQLKSGVCVECLQTLNTHPILCVWCVC
jgi:hypothetical protein